MNDVLVWRATHQPDRLAQTFLGDDGSESTFTYRQLLEKALSVAAALADAHAAGERVLLVYPPGLDYVAGFFGCLLAGAIAVPVYPPKSARNVPRLLAIVEDAKPSVALTTSGVKESSAPLAADSPRLAALDWIATDVLPPAPDAPIRAAAPETLAFLQYTSGSTARPKGVMLTHANLLHNLACIYESFGHSPESCGLVWLPPYHDMGLIGGILQPIYGGFHCVLMSPTMLLWRPGFWLRAIARFKATSSGGPNFAYDLCVRKIPPSDREKLDLSSWEVAFTGAEPVRADTLEQFAKAFAVSGFKREAFYPCYGLAEATLMAAGGEKRAPAKILSVDGDELGRGFVKRLEGQKNGDSGAAHVKQLIGCGGSMPDQEISIVDPTTLVRCAPDQVGEIWLRGPSVAAGYWGREEQTKETFGGRYQGQTSGGSYLRTGDMGFLHEGELYITSRIKDLIIIRGANISPQDVEYTVETSHPRLRPSCGAAFSVDVDGEERLIIAHEIDVKQPSDVDEAIRAILVAVPRYHGVSPYEVALIKPWSIHKTSSGKIMRQACKRDYLDGTLQVVRLHRVETDPRGSLGRVIGGGPMTGSGS